MVERRLGVPGPCTLVAKRSLTWIVALALTGCMVGPDYKTPLATVQDHWQETNGHGLTADATNEKEWWKTFNDPVLDHLVSLAYAQNLDLKVAGLRVIEARAQRGIAAGLFFPQVQQFAGNAAFANTSAVTANPLQDQNFQDYALGFNVFWEADVWGRFRRGIESADASLYASVMNYDDALVSLVSDVASTYMDIRSIDKRLTFARMNVKIQQDTLDVVNTRYKHGEATELDFQQARSNLTNTEAARAHAAERRGGRARLCSACCWASRRKTCTRCWGKRRKCPRRPRPSPSAPRRSCCGAAPTSAAPERARRSPVRPDWRRGLAALSALRGSGGTIGYEAEDVSKMFTGKGFTGSFGPSFQWDILNYGRLENDIRVQDARFEQLIIQYQNTVLRAAGEVESASTAYLMSQEEGRYLVESVDASRKAVDLALTQYRGGEVDFIRVLDTQSFLATQQDRLASVQRDVAVNLITLHRALGGGWELHQGNEFVDEAIVKQMRERTDWGNVIGREYPKGELIKPAKFEREEAATPKPAQTQPAGS